MKLSLPHPLWIGVAAATVAVGYAGVYWHFFRTGPVFDIGGTEFLIDLDRANLRAKLLNKPGLLYFCASNSVNARRMEATVLRAPAVTGRLRRFTCVAAFVDSVPFVDTKSSKDIVDRNEKLEEDLLGDVSIPAFAVVTPGFDHLNPTEQSNVLAVSSGLLDEAAFVQFLESALTKWDELQKSQSQRRNK